MIVLMAAGVAVLTLLAVVLPGAGGSQSGASSSQGIGASVRVVSQVDQEPSRSTSSGLACTAVDKPANFRLYSLGLEFEGLPLRNVLRQCESPPPPALVRANLDSRANSASYIYGTCEVPAGEEGGCAPPLEIQVWPACERGPADYDPGSQLRSDLQTRRGVPSAKITDGIEVYSDSTIVVFADDPQLAERAVASLVPLPETRAPSALPESNVGSRPNGPLAQPPAGALDGNLRCSS